MISEEHNRVISRLWDPLILVAELHQNMPAATLPNPFSFPFKYYFIK